MPRLLALCASTLCLYTACDKGEDESEDKKSDKEEVSADKADADKADADKADADKTAADKAAADKTAADKPADAPATPPTEPVVAEPAAVEGLGEAPTFEVLADAPFEVSDFKVKIKSQQFSSRKGKYLTLDFKAKRLKDPGERPAFHIKAACQVGEQVAADVHRPFGKLEEMEDGESKQVESSLFMGGPVPTEPTMCEFTVFFQEGSGSTNDPKIIKDLCWTGQAVADGKCADLKRQETTDLVKVVDVSAKLEKIKYGDGKGNKSIATDYTVLVGGTVDDDHAVEIKAACMVDGDKLVDSRRMFSELRFMGPGESMLASHSAYSKGLEKDPTSCDLTFQLKEYSDDKGDVVGEFCFKDGEVNEGKCS